MTQRELYRERCRQLRGAVTVVDQRDRPIADCVVSGYALDFARVHSPAGEYLGEWSWESVYRAMQGGWLSM